MANETVYVRVTAPLKRAAENRAREAGLSLNEFVVQAMEQAVGVTEDASRAARLNIETTIAFLQARALKGETATYMEVANANGFPNSEWPRVHRSMTPHLYAVGHECQTRELPMLTALVVTQMTGEPSNGLDKLAAELGMIVGDRERFIAQKQEEAFEWARRVKGGSQATPRDWSSLEGLWTGPQVEDVIAWARGEADETRRP